MVVGWKFLTHATAVPTERLVNKRAISVLNSVFGRHVQARTVFFREEWKICLQQQLSLASPCVSLFLSGAETFSPSCGFFHKSLQRQVCMGGRGRLVALRQYRQQYTTLFAAFNYESCRLASIHHAAVGTRSQRKTETAVYRHSLVYRYLRYLFALN